MGKSVEEMKEMPFVGTTKKAFADALKDAVAMLEGKPTVQSTTDVAKATAVKAALGIASKDVSGIVSDLNSMVVEIESASGTYKELQVAIDAKKAELKDVHNIEVELNTLAAILVAKDSMVAERVEEANAMIVTAKERSVVIVETAEVKAAEIRSELNEEEAATKQSQKRSEDEWEYDFDRRKKATMDELNDAIVTETKKLEDRELELDEREEELEGVVVENAQLKITMVENAEAVEEAIRKAASSAKGKAEGIAKSQADIRQREFEADTKIVLAQVETLEERNEQLVAELEAVKEVNAKSAEQVTEIANNALKATADKATISAMLDSQKK